MIDKETFVWTTCREATINQDELSKFVPVECLDYRKVVKMLDTFPLKMFTPENCLKAFMDHSYFIEAALNDALFREVILNYLTICFGIMVLYYYHAISDRLQDQSHRNNEGVPYCIFNIDFAVKYMG